MNEETPVEYEEEEEDEEEEVEITPSRRNRSGLFKYGTDVVTRHNRRGTPVRSPISSRITPVIARTPHDPTPSTSRYTNSVIPR